jgi:hypothetical protein
MSYHMYNDINFTIELNGLELEAEADVEYSDYVPARIYGDPQFCYPEEGGELNIISLRLVRYGADDVDITFLLRSLPALREKMEQTLEEIIKEDKFEDF